MKFLFKCYFSKKKQFESDLFQTVRVVTNTVKAKLQNTGDEIKDTDAVTMGVGGRRVKRGFLDMSVVCFIKLVFASPAHIRTDPSIQSPLRRLSHSDSLSDQSYILQVYLLLHFYSQVPLPHPLKRERKPTKTSLSLCPPTAFPAPRLVRPAPAGIRNVEEPLTQFSPHYLYYFKSLTIIFSLLRFALLISLRFCFPAVPSTFHTIHTSFSDRYFSLFISLEFFFFCYFFRYVVM